MVKEYENNGTALAEALGKPYAFIYRLSDVYRGKTPKYPFLPAHCSLNRILCPTAAAYCT